MLKAIETTLITLRNTKPLVLNLTNVVTMDFIANSLLSLGCAPIMSICDAELEELIAISHSLYINIGTLDAAFIQRAYKAIEWAKRYNKPIILDPVGSGATALRTQTAREFMVHADIIRGNASEIISLESNTVRTLGVESLSPTAHAQHAATTLAKRYVMSVVVSGEIDFITDGSRHIELTYGSPLMPLVTGMGCTLTAVIAAFRGVQSDSWISATQATGYFGLCGNLAATKAEGPAAFRTAFIDELFAADFAAMVKFADHSTREKYREE